MLLIGLFPHTAYAAEHDNSLGGAFDSIRQLFAFLPELITMEKLLGHDPAATFWAKFLIWLVFFAVFYFGASMVFKQNTRVAVIVALVFSLISALMIPSDIISSIFQTYGFLAAVIFWAVPVIAGFALAHQVKHRLIKAFIYALAAWVLFSINVTIVTTDIVSVSFPYFGLLFAVVLILFLWNLFAGFGELGIGGGGGLHWPGGGLFDNADAGARDVSRDLGNWFRRKARTPTEEEQQLVENAQKIRDNITRLEGELSRSLKTDDERELLLQLAKLIMQLKDIQTELLSLRRTS